MKIVCALAFAAFSTSCMAENVLNVQTPAVLPKETGIPDAIKEKCKVPEVVGSHIFTSVSDVYDKTRRVADGADIADGMLLKTTITSVWGASYGGGWSGPRHISVTVDLIKNGKVLQTTAFRRTSNGGALGAFKSTCSIVDRIAKELGEDAADWVKDNLSEIRRG